MSETTEGSLPASNVNPAVGTRWMGGLKKWVIAMKPETKLAKPGTQFILLRSYCSILKVALLDWDGAMLN